MALPWEEIPEQKNKGALEWETTTGFAHEPITPGKPLNQQQVQSLHSVGVSTIGPAEPKKEPEDTWLKKMARFILPRSLEVRMGITEPNTWDTMMKNEDSRLSYLREKQFLELYKKEVTESPKISSKYKEPTTFGGQFLEGLKLGYISSVKGGFGYFVESMGAEIGRPDWIEWGANLGDRATIEVIKRPELLDPEDLKPFIEGGLIDQRWWGRRMGQTLPFMGTAIGLATLGGLVGGPKGAMVGGFTASAALEKGNSYKRYIDEGVPPDKADTYSTVYGTIAGAIENMFGVSPAKIGTSIATRGAQRVVFDSYKSFLLREIPRVGITTLKTSLAEGGEEVAQGITENLVLKFYKTETPVFTKDLVEEFASGFAASLPWGAVNIRIPDIKTSTPQEIKAIEQSIKKTDEVLQKTEPIVSPETPAIPKELEPLAQEARKLDTTIGGRLINEAEANYKTFKPLNTLPKWALEDEFGIGKIPQKLTVYNAGKEITGKPIFVTTDINYAKEFLKPGEKITTFKDVPIGELRVYGEGRITATNRLTGTRGQEFIYKPPQATKGITEVKPEVKFPANKYKLELLEEIEKLETLPKIDPTAFQWTPPTLEYNNPFTRVMMKAWQKVGKIWDTKAPAILKESQAQEVSQLLKERQRVYDGLVKKYYEETIRPLTKLTTAEKQKIGSMIFKRINIPADYEATIKDIDTKIGQLGQAIVNIDKEMITKGLLKKDMSLLAEETWMQNLGEYARTLYVKIKDGKAEITPRSTLTPDGVIDRSAFKHKLTDAEWGANALSFEGKTIEEIKQYTPEDLESIGTEAKEKYGWTFQADYILAKTFQDMSKAYASRLFQKAIVENPRLFTKDEKTAKELGFVQVRDIIPKALAIYTKEGIKSLSQSNRLGPLMNGYIHPGLQEEIKTFLVGKTKDAVMSLFQEPLSWWKAFKVAGNPPTVIRNFISGAVLQTDMAGYPVWTPENSIRYIKSVKSYLTKDATYKKLRDGGQYGSDYFTVEIETDEMARIIAKAEKSNNPMATASEEILSKIGGKLKDAKQVFSYYGLIDHMQRTYLAASAIEHGASVAQAVHFANKWELDYRFVPKFVESLRQGLPGWLYPFLSFYTLMAPRIAEVLITRPWVLLKYPILIGIFNAISSTMLGADDDELENAKPEWLQDKDYLITLPMRDNEGNFQFLDLDYVFPFGGPTSMFMDWDQVLMMLKNPGMMNTMMNIMNNYDTFTERKIFNDTDLDEDKAKKISEYVVRNMGPGFVTHALNIWRAAQGETIGFPIQKERDLAQTVARSLGVSVYSGGFNEAFNKIRNIQGEIGDIEWSMGVLMKNPNISPEEKQRKVIEFQDEIRRRAEKIREISKNMPQATPSKEESTGALPWE